MKKTVYLCDINHNLISITMKKLITTLAAITLIVAMAAAQEPERKWLKKDVQTLEQCRPTPIDSAIFIVMSPERVPYGAHNIGSGHYYCKGWSADKGTADVMLREALAEARRMGARYITIDHMIDHCNEDFIGGVELYIHFFK